MGYFRNDARQGVSLWFFNKRLVLSGFGFKGVDYDLPELENSYASQLKKKITDIQTNKTEDPYGWRVHL